MLMDTLVHLLNGTEPPAAFSLQSCCMKEGKSLFRPGKMPSCQDGISFSEGVFSSSSQWSFPKNTSLLENTKQSSIDKEKASQGNGWRFAFSWYLFHVMQWNFGHFLFAWTLTTISPFLQCCNWPRASSQCVFCTHLQLPRYCILSHNGQRVVL